MGPASIFGLSKRRTHRLVNGLPSNHPNIECGRVSAGKNCRARDREVTRAVRLVLVLVDWSARERKSDFW